MDDAKPCKHLINAHGSCQWCHKERDTLRIESLESEKTKLQAFKDWVHNYLDTHGVPHHPPGTHGAAGCRIGDRMDWLMAKIATAKAEHSALAAAIAEAVIAAGICNDGARSANGPELLMFLDDLAKSSASVARVR